MVSDGEANEPENNELQLNEHPDINVENPEDPGGKYCSCFTSEILVQQWTNGRQNSSGGVGNSFM